MDISVFSCLTAFLWFDLALIVCSLLRRQGRVMARFGLGPLILIPAAGLIRLFCPFTLPNTRVIHSTAVLPAALAVLRTSVPGLPITIGQGLLAVWISGAAIRTAKLFLDIRKDQKAVRSCTALRDPRIETIVRKITGRCSFILTEQAGTPLMTGFFRPVLILPAYLIDFTDEEIGFIVRHEWQHFRRRNHWWKLAVELILCIFWWNPPIYLLRRDAEQLMELDCDHRVVQGMNADDRAAYLQTILKSIRQQQSGTVLDGRLPLRLLGSDRSSNIQQRFKMVAGQNDTGRRRLGTLLSAVCLVLTFAASMTVVVQPFQMLDVDTMEEMNIGAYDVPSGDFYVEEDPNGQFTAHFFGVPVYSYIGVAYEFTGILPGAQYLYLGDARGDQDVLTLSRRGSGLSPVYIRDEEGNLTQVKLPEGVTLSAVTEPAADKNECVLYFRHSENGALWQRSWSATYQCWMSEWIRAIDW